MGKLEHGFYDDSDDSDEYSDVDPEILNHFYGTTRNNVRRREGQTGAGHPPDENSDSSSSDSEPDSASEVAESTVQSSDSDSEPEIPLPDQTLPGSPTEEDINNQVRNQVHEKAVKVPHQENPFSSQEDLDAFHHALTAMEDGSIVPDGYGILPEEWDEDDYPNFEIIRTGRRGTKQLRISLPDEIWRPRAEQWVQGLYAMTRILESLESQT
jgi:hypothetical protein